MELVFINVQFHKFHSKGLGNKGSDHYVNVQSQKLHSERNQQLFLYKSVQSQQHHSGLRGKGNGFRSSVRIIREFGCFLNVYQSHAGIVLLWEDLRIMVMYT